MPPPTDAHALGEEFSDLFEEAPIPYVHEAMDSRFIRANRAARLLLGVAIDEIEGTLGKSLIADTPESQQKLQEAFEGIQRGETPAAIVVELRRKDNGRALWVEWSSRPAPSGLYTRTMLVDVTQRVLVEQTKAALEFSLESGQVGEWDLDLVRDTSRRSLRHDRCFGYEVPVPEQEWGARTFIQHLHEEDRDRVERIMRQAVDELREWSAEFRVIWPDGSLHWLVAKGNIYRTNDDGSAARMLGIVMDITDRKRTEEALAVSERLARGQVDALTRTIEALAKESDPDRLLEYVLRTITDQLGASSCSVWRTHGAGATARLECSYEGARLVSYHEGSSRPPVSSMQFEQSTVWLRGFSSGDASVVQDLRVLPDIPWRARLRETGVVTVLMVPMALAGRLDGVVAVQFTSRRDLCEKEIELAQALVNQAMFAMQLTKASVLRREAAVVAERNRMAREIHDTLAHGLTGVIVQLEAAADALSRGLAAETDRHISNASGLARESLSEARRSVRALRPQELEDSDLCDALDALIQKMTAGTALDGEFVVKGIPTRLPPDQEDNVLRAVKEVLTNSLRHSSASRFHASIEFLPHEVRLDLRDDGRGFDPSARFDGFGLRGVSERVRLMKGHMTLDSQAGSGTRYAIVLPRTSVPESAA